MDSDKESERLFSMRLSSVMDNIGVNKFMIDWRRTTFLRLETILRVCHMIDNSYLPTYFFGSQSEVTTTPGMESDVDTLISDENMNVILEWNKWQKGKPNLLVLRDEHTPPQHCYLQRMRGDVREPAVQTEGPNDVLISDGRVLVANTCVEVQFFFSKDPEIIHSGPSISNTSEVDNVNAYQCAELPEECKFMFHRPRPGHWPRKDIMDRARQSVVFLVPQGYSESPARRVTCKPSAFVCKIPSTSPNYPYSKWQWRFSTSLMERYLMFDLTVEQVKAYTLAKVIRKSVFKPLYGDRFSTFHIKTAMMYTVENYPPTIWREDNIVQCVSLILTTLTRWLKRKYCPHFTIFGVNLFVGKLHKWELPKLCGIISNLINTKLQCLNDVKMDHINIRLHQYKCHEVKQGVDLRTFSIYEPVIFDEILGYAIGSIVGHVKLFLTDSHEKLLINLNIFGGKCNSLSVIEKEAVSVIVPFVYSILASKLASMRIYLGEPITQHILDYYKLSFDSDLMSSKLKFASMLYCRGQYEEAADVLNDYEGLLGPKVCQYCAHVQGSNVLQEVHKLCKKEIIYSLKKILTTHIMVCIRFSEEEINCIPKHVAYELCRCVETKDRGPLDEWKDNVVIDCIPFLYYLQHITYRELHQPMKALTALDHLLEYTKGTRHGHIDTALNMLGHCFELQNRLDQAWLCYRNSLNIYNKDNAAGWHVARIIHECITKTTPPSGW